MSFREPSLSKGEAGSRLREHREVWCIAKTRIPEGLPWPTGHHYERTDRQEEARHTGMLIFGDGPRAISALRKAAAQFQCCAIQAKPLRRVAAYEIAQFEV